MTEEKLRKYDKEIFVQYLYRHSYHRHDVIRELNQIQKDLKFKQLMERNRLLLEEMQTLTGIENYEKWHELCKKQEKTSREISKLLGL